MPGSRSVRTRRHSGRVPVDPVAGEQLRARGEEVLDIAFGRDARHLHGDERQAEVAGRLGRDQPFISGIEARQRRVDVVERLDLAEAIGFDPRALIDQIRRTPKN